MLAEGSMQGQASGIPLTETYAAVNTLVHGRVIGVQEYFDHAQALRAVGLSR